MKKSAAIVSVVSDQRAERRKIGRVAATVSQVGGVTLFRSIANDQNGQRVIVELASSSTKQLTLETAKQIRAIVATPISSEQRSKAAHLAKNAKDAQASAVTAKFRRPS